MAPTQGRYIHVLQLCMRPSYFWGSDPSLLPLISHTAWQHMLGHIINTVWQCLLKFTELSPTAML